MKNQTHTPIQKRRIEAGFSQSQAAEALGMLRTNLSGLENGKWTPGLETCASLARLYQCSIDDIAADLGVRVA